MKATNPVLTLSFNYSLTLVRVPEKETEEKRNKTDRQLSDFYWMMQDYFAKISKEYLYFY